MLAGCKVVTGALVDDASGDVETGGYVVAIVVATDGTVVVDEAAVVEGTVVVATGAVEDGTAVVVATGGTVVVPADEVFGA